MPMIYDATCINCGMPERLTFHADGSIKQSCHVCRGDREARRTHAPGDAWLRPHWYLLRAVKIADRFLDCISEFSTPGVDGKCLCNSCGEHLEEMCGAVQVALAKPEERNDSR